MSTLSINKILHRSANATTLDDLKDIIESELTFWTHWTTALRGTQTYSEITSCPASSDTKAVALRYLLETLPLRYKALSKAYCNADNNLEHVVLSDILAALLKSLRKENDKAELEDWFDYKLFKGKKFRQDVLTMDDEVRRLEEARMESLKGLMVICEELRIVDEEGKLRKEAVQGLIDAMDEVGLNAGSINEIQQDEKTGSKTA